MRSAAGPPDAIRCHEEMGNRSYRKSHSSDGTGMAGMALGQNVWKCVRVRKFVELSASSPSSYLEEAR